MCIYIYFLQKPFLTIFKLSIFYFLWIYRFQYWFWELGIPGIHESGKRTVNLQPSDSICISSAHGHFNASCCWNPIHLYLTWMFSLHSVLQAVLGLALWDRTVFWGKARSFIFDDGVVSLRGREESYKQSECVKLFTLELPRGKVSVKTNSRNSLSLMELHGVNTSPKTMCV